MKVPDARKAPDAIRVRDTMEVPDTMKVWPMRASGRQAPWGRHFAALALVVTISLFACSAAWAQTPLSGGPVGTTSRVGRAASTPEKPPEPAPDAIPGAKPREAAAPATRPAGDMQPTDALFDAINRGDLASARDALNRGADLNGANILGMTPMELSVDLGRNDISFLLLSMRGEDVGRGSRAVGRDLPAAGPAGPTTTRGEKPGVGGRPVANKVAAGKRGPAAVAAAPRPVATPKLFANDGGTPLPSAGFLGFDSRASSN
jgi:hypothetical protein